MHTILALGALTVAFTVAAIGIRSSRPCHSHSAVVGVCVIAGLIVVALLLGGH